MPTGRETVPNRLLSGRELKDILRADFESLLANEGRLSDHVGYGRVAYEIELRMHFDNALAPESSVAMRSRPPAVNVLPTAPELATVETPPLRAASESAEVASVELSRKVSSPNVERLRVGLPIPIEVKQQDGTVTTEHVKYPPQETEDTGKEVSGTTERTRQWWGL